MTKHLERDLESLRSQLIDQFASVEQMIQLAVRSLVERRSDLADRVIESDEKANLSEFYDTPRHTMQCEFDTYVADLMRELARGRARVVRAS